MLHENGVRNIEMESSIVAAMCNRAKVRACVMCVTLVDRTAKDQVLLTSESREEFEKRPWYLLLEFIKKNVTLLSTDS